MAGLTFISCSFPLERSRSIVSRSVGTAFPLAFAWTQPEPGVRWLHRLLHDGEQMLAQLLQIDLAPQCGSECSKRTSRIILTAIETAVNALLNTPSKRLEGCRDGERRADDHERRLA